MRRNLIVAATLSFLAMSVVACKSVSNQDTENAASSSNNSNSVANSEFNSGKAAEPSAKLATDREISEDEVGKILETQVLSTEEIISAPNGAETMRVSYGSRNAHGEPIVATGLVTLPEGEEPEGGWPVLSWAHGTTGLAEKCAPSLAINDHPDSEALTLAADYLQVWLDKGFAVVQPDYEGLGTTGKGTYMDGPSLAAAVNEMVRATRDEFNFSDKWYNTGWSQGGFAAVQAAGAEDVPSGLVRTFAIAPGDTQVPGAVSDNPAAFKAASETVDPQLLAYTAYTIQGAANIKPDVIKPADFLNDKGLAVLDMASTECLTTFKAKNKTPGKDIIKDNPQVEPLMNHLNENSMINLRPASPTVIFISEDDEIINYDSISNSANKLAEKEGVDVDVQVRTGEGHRDMVRRAIEDQTPYVPELQ